MALDASHEHSQGRPIESGACCPAEEIAGTFYVRLETRAGFTWIPAGRRPVNQRKKTIQLGVIADTHGLYDAAIEEHFAGVTEILHAGDIGDHSVIERLNKIAPVVAVSGNVDEYEKSGFPRQVTIRRGGMKIAIRHVLYEKGKLTKEAQVWLDREQPAVCVFGHSHRPTIEQYGPTILFNPGSAGPKRFSLPRGIGILMLQKEKVVPRFIRLEDKVSRHHARPSAKRSKKSG